jgi:DNA-binding NarL/FixJ family response regulator
MKDEIQVIIIEDDPFARNWMVIVAVRDWRTRVVGEIDHPSKLDWLLQEKKDTIDFIVIDTDIPGGEDWIPGLLATISKLDKQPRILCTGIKPNPRVLKKLSHPAFVGYVLKEEIRYSLAWAISMAIEGNWVITDGVKQLAVKTGFQLPKPCIVMDGRNVIGHLDERKANVARLAFLFSIERRELADELNVGADYGHQLVSYAYKELGIKDILEDEDTLDAYFGKYDFIMAYIQELRQKMKGKKKVRDMETLAFHMLTMPEMQELS